MKNIFDKSNITASDDITSIEDLEKALRILLDAELCEAVVNLAYSTDGVFGGDVFLPSEEFFEDSLYGYEAKDVAMKFFNGEDLDSRGPANPNRDYFRFNGYDNVESTNDPGEIYLDELDIELVDYIIDHLDDREFPDDIQEIIDEYASNKEE